MIVENYDVVFNLAQESYDGWLTVAFGAIFVAIGLAMAALESRAATKGFGVVFALLATAWSIFAGLGSWQHYERLQTDFREGRFSDIEGIAGYRPNPRDPADSDILSIGPQAFEITGPRGSAAYHRSLNYGGFDMSGRCVRLFYTERREIIWLALRKEGCEPNEMPQSDPDAHIGQWDP
jgi:hypothetical protein